MQQSVLYGAYDTPEPVLPRPALAVRQPPKFTKFCADRHRPRAVNVPGRLSRQSTVTVRILRLTVKNIIRSLTVN